MKEFKEPPPPVYDPHKPLRGKNIAPFFPIVQMCYDDGKISGPMSSLVLYESLPKNYILNLVRPDPPIVHIFEKTEESKAAAKVERKASKVKQRKQELAMEQKEVQMTWDVSWADANHKMGKVREILEKGQRAAVVIAAKPTMRQPREYEMDAVLEQLLVMIQDVGEEWQERQLNRGTLVLRLQPRKR